MPRKKLPVFLTPKEASRLVAAARNMRDRLIMLCGLWLGLRCAEICKLRAEHIRLTDRRLLVKEGKGKKDRMLPLNAKMARMLGLWLRGRTSGWLFPSARCAGKPLRTRTIQYLVENAAARAGIKRPDGRVVHPHALRRAFASQLSRQKVELAVIRDLLGHRNIATTNSYLSCGEDQLQEAVDLL